MHNSSIVEEPTHLASDYIEMTYLALLIMTGIPSNLIMLRRLMNDLKRAPKDSVKYRFTVLKINLNISDLMLLIIVAIGQLVWLITYDWQWGDLACRLYKFGTMVALYISSNIVVCIAVDRVRNVLSAKKLRRGQGTHVALLGLDEYFQRSLVHMLLIMSWLFSIIWSLPQLIFWQTKEVVPGFVQCTEIWTLNRNGYIEDNTSWIYADTVQDAYQMAHLNGTIRPDFTSTHSGYEQSISLHQLESTTVSVDHRRSTPRAPSLRRSFERNSERGGSPMMRRSGSKLSALHFSKYFGKGGRSMDNIYAHDKGAAIKTPPKKVSRASDQAPAAPRISWKRQLKNKVFRATVLVVITHIIFWLPYNLRAAMQYIDEDKFQFLSEHANIFKHMQLLITLINPFIYGFSN